MPAPVEDFLVNRAPSIARLIAEKQSAGHTPFICKIDIEGGEADLFTPPTDWVDRFR